ncbi:MAG: superoxide dismutase [Verrucomicrobiales bacterium]|nr:superoxide dismutase [Verrucomicrobiales bacterium]
MINRRTALKTVALAPAAAALAADSARAQNPPAATPAPTGPHQLDPLPYAVTALEPFIDAKTMEIHHDRHHAAYVLSLNRALAGHADLANKSAQELISDLPAVPESIRGAVRNHAGGHVNHTLFWKILKRNGGSTPSGPLMEAIVRKFGTFDGFKAELTRASMSVFGSGWAWLSRDRSGDVLIETPANQDSPYLTGRVPLLGIDVWEHAYYLKYQNKRADYVAAFFNVIHWDYVAERFAKPS